MIGFGLGAAIGLKEITSDQDVLFVPFRIPKVIVVDADEIFSGMISRTFQETLLIPVHSVTGGNYKAIINEGFHRYLNNVQKINSTDKGCLHQCLQGVLFALYYWNAGPVDGTGIS